MIERFWLPKAGGRVAIQFQRSQLRPPKAAAHSQVQLQHSQPRPPKAAVVLSLVIVQGSSLQPEPLHLGPLTPFALGSLPRARSH